MPKARYPAIGNLQQSPTRVVLFGMNCAFTLPTLTVLTAAESVELVAVVMPKDATPIKPSDPTSRAVEASGVRRVNVSGRAALSGKEFRRALERLAPDIVVAACFPWRLPQWLLSLPSGGCINIHPSLLPDGQGPEPIFWAFRRGLTETGVTLHQMDRGFDTGPILSQRRVLIHDGASLDSLEQELATIGASLALEYLEHRSRFASAPASPALTPQYAGFPTAQDFVVPTTWHVGHAARFISAVFPTYGPVPVLVHASGQRLSVRRVLGIDERKPCGESVTLEGNIAQIRSASGMLVCEVVQDRKPLLLHGRQP